MHHPSPHIVMLNKSYPPWMGGVEKHLGDISEALVQRGWRVTALVCSDTDEFVDEEINGVHVQRVPRWSTVLSQPLTVGYKKALRALQPDLVHCHVPFPLAWMAVDPLPHRVPIVCTWHSDIVRQRIFMPFLSFFEQRFLRRCQRIVVTSPEYLQSSLPLRRHQPKCEVIPLALPPPNDEDPTEMHRLKERFQQRFRHKTVLSVGRLVGYKGLPVLLHAMRDIEADLILAGDGRLKETLYRQARRMGLQNRIHFLGHVSEAEKQALFQIADVFVLPSYQRNEAFGYVLLEAMSNGCPVISTDIDTGVRWVNQHHQTGLVVPPKNPSALAHAIQEILHDPAKRQTFSQNAKQRVQRDFSFQTNLDRLERIYRDFYPQP